LIDAFGFITPELRIVSTTDRLSSDGKAELAFNSENYRAVYNAMNLRLGASMQDDQLPKHALKPLPDSPAAGNVPDLSRQLKEYYALRGWDPITGHPSQERLRALGIESLSACLPARR